MNVGRLFVLLADRYGWTAETCSMLTPAQIIMYLDSSASAYPMPYSEWKARKRQGGKP